MNTSIIEECLNKPENCIPDGIKYCSIGKIGPLCEKCDIYGEVWN